MNRKIFKEISPSEFTMTEENYVALYRRGNCQPLGAVRESMVEPLLADLQAYTHKDYWTKPITQEEAQQITKDITRCSEGVEKLLAEKTE
jgi:NDP-sugar pyrophosphorylase family protein